MHSRCLGCSTFSSKNRQGSIIQNFTHATNFDRVVIRFTCNAHVATIVILSVRPHYPYESTLTPVCTPRVQDAPILVGTFFAIANKGDCMVDICICWAILLCQDAATVKIPTITSLNTYCDWAMLYQSLLN